MTKQPNFVFIVTDQHCAHWLGCAGHPVLKTPNIDRLAARGVRFTEFHTAAPVCMPNRASILTGRYPSVHGLKYNGCALSPKARTFVEMLKEGGYQTAAIGKSHLQPFTGAKLSRVSDPNSDAPALEAWKQDFSGLDIESPNHYEEADTLDFPVPYYGYDYIDMVTGHGDTAGGHYIQWLRKQAPNWQELCDPENQLPHNYTCEQAKRTRLPTELYPTRYIENRTCEWLENSRDEDKPFFLFVSFPDPHHPFNPPGDYWDKYHPDEFELTTRYEDFAEAPFPLQYTQDQLLKGEKPATPQEAIAATDQHCKEAMALTAGMIAMIDDSVGHILDTLSQEKLDEDTIVIFTSDHGDYLGDANLLLKGPWIRQSIHHVPFIWADPFGGPKGETETLASSVDIGTTILNRAGVTPYFGMQGRDLLNDIKTQDGRDAVLIEFNDNGPRMGLSKAARTRTIYTPQYRLTVYANEDFGELYSTANDPHHLHNLWDSSQHAAIKSDLLYRLSEMLTVNMDESPRAIMRA
ncbi:sulfatase family protein [Ahrensia kielensis]|uniref:sulfatase family protein n=1 Tax=Ahrensia kielensis TaxID=76980 RepID=UPI000366809A|nr:sulfatase-like hydrolase/transferase [Ahrensia kielensis]